ncbi:putative zinc metallo-protease [Jaminaea rosea]|uniref:Ste24 endopeptidase n=1 Tax=Jaminaea rosea TaxID=1569628 RepID=A0A316V0E7_9BASI|nr:putative zinc metallo-protease [Jaminaea rosea]PWN31016.1 putative zinc metallo-protease [Jaminaea rosea]
MSGHIVQAAKHQLHSAFAALDDPAVPWKTLVLYLIVGVWAFETYLSLRQYKVYSFPSPPASLLQHVDLETYKKSQRYGRDKARFGFVVAAWGLLNSLAIVYFDLMPFFWQLSADVLQKLDWRTTEITQSIIFTLLSSLSRTILDLPLSYYSHFYLEEAHGFNKMTRTTFFTDFLKSTALGGIVLSPVIAALISIIRWAGTDGFVLWVLVFMLAFQVVLQVLYPLVIQPLFNTLTPLPPGLLKARVEILAASLRFPLAKLHQIDGSRRSAHSNAYFFGVLPWGNKHIVVYDSLIAKSTCSEIEAVLAHELGHWAHSDPTKLLVLAQAQIGFTFAVFAGFIDNRSLFEAFGFGQASTLAEKAGLASPVLPVIIGLELFQLVLAPLDAVLKFLMNSAVRSMEYAADSFAAGLDRPAFTDEQVKEMHKEPEPVAEKEESQSQEKGPEKKDEDQATRKELREAELAQSTQTSYAELLQVALIKLHKQNLSSMHYDWLYSAYHHSHPTLPERLAALEKHAGAVDRAKKAN